MTYQIHEWVLANRSSCCVNWFCVSCSGWRLFDDSTVTTVEESQVVTRYAYVLFYRRRNSPVERPPRLLDPLGAESPATAGAAASQVSWLHSLLCNGFTFHQLSRFNSHELCDHEKILFVLPKLHLMTLKRFIWEVYSSGWLMAILVV